MMRKYAYVLLTLGFVACSSIACSAGRGQQGSVSQGAQAGEAGSGGGGQAGSVGSAGTFGTAGAGSNIGCKNLECQQVSCDPGKSTQVTGVVHAPTPPMYGPADPLYNVIVYIPNGTVDPLPDGVTCDQCGTPVSGSPLIATLTNSKGEFTLDNMPAGKDIPLVVQIGKWRRQVTIPEVVACEVTPLPDELTRLPRNQKEGDIPRIAIASSPYDAEECILRKIGVEDSEFTNPAADGRIHIYQGGGATVAGTLPMDALWGSIQALMRYDMALFPCSSVPGSDPSAMKNVFDYANAGGRVFATDLSYPWFQQGPDPFPSTTQWVPWGPISDPLPASVDTSFPKGQALAEWLQNIGATQQLGSIELHETYHCVDGVNPPTLRWLYSQSPNSVQTLSFNTPVGVDAKEQCGRAVYSNFHVANGSTIAGTPYPEECDSKPLTPQEKVLEFLLFDLASCVQDDHDDPIPPK
jgi:hypothetical protein